MKCILMIACLYLSGIAVVAQAKDAAPCQVHVILFMPSEVEPPTGYQQRIDQMADYAESFFQRNSSAGSREGRRALLPIAKGPSRSDNECAAKKRSRSTSRLIFVSKS